MRAAHSGMVTPVIAIVVRGVAPEVTDHRPCSFNHARAASHAACSERWREPLWKRAPHGERQYRAGRWECRRRGFTSGAREIRSPRRKRRAALAATIAYLFTRHNATYGSTRITADLRAMGWRVSKNTVAILMAE
jgi:hypothetical protein